MTRCRALLAIEALALLGLLVFALTRPVTESRGRDEIDYRNWQPFPLAAQQTVTQPLPLQQDQLAGLAIPYQLQGSQPAQIRVLVVDAGGRALIESVEQLAPSKAMDFATVRVEAPAGTDQVTATIQRVDRLNGVLNLEAFPTDTTGRPSMVELPTNTLAVVTLYGAWGPAILKAPVYASRVASLAAPWLPEPVELVLTAVFLVLGLALVAMLASERVEPEASPIMAAEFAPADATSSRDRDPRLP
jgi:hypothetical protein